MCSFLNFNLLNKNYTDLKYKALMNIQFNITICSNLIGNQYFNRIKNFYITFAVILVFVPQIVQLNNTQI